MKVLRVYLMVAFIVVLVYTIKTTQVYGWNLFSVFFGNIAQMDWSGQFNLDFLGFLILTGLWVSWRNHFGFRGIALGILAFLLGMSFLAPYLLYLSFKSKANIKTVLIGE